MSEDERKALEQTLNTSWPEIQKHLIEEGAKESGHKGDPYEPYWTTNEDGTRVLHMSSDSWWLREFRREDVIIALPGVCVMNTQHWHVDAAAQTLREAYGLRRFDQIAMTASRKTTSWRISSAFQKASSWRFASAAWARGMPSPWLLPCVHRGLH